MLHISRMAPLALHLPQHGNTKTREMKIEGAPRQKEHLLVNADRKRAGLLKPGAK